MVASRANQERIQADLVASRATSEELHRSNEELRRDLQNRTGERGEEDQEPATPPREFPMPFSQEIMDVVIPATRAQGDLHWCRGPGGPSHDFLHADDAGWGLRCGEMQAVHEHPDGNCDGLVHQPP